MTEKYEDLATRISDDLEPTMVGDAYIRNSLRWLDEHPDQVPGRTITESEFHDVADAHRNGGLGWRDLADSLGITVVPDPKPTNAEKLAELLRQESSLTNFGAQTVARRLDKAGVRAVGDDD